MIVKSVGRLGRSEPVNSSGMKSCVFRSCPVCEIMRAMASRAESGSLVYEGSRVIVASVWLLWYMIACNVIGR